MEGDVGGIKAQGLFPNDSLSISREGPGGWSQGPEMLAAAPLYPSNFHRLPQESILVLAGMALSTWK